MRIKIKVKKKAEHNPHLVQEYDPQRKTRRDGRVFCLDCGAWDCQNCFGRPACFNTPLAECLDRIFPSTVNGRLAIGENQISWSPFPCRTK